MVGDNRPPERARKQLVIATWPNLSAFWPILPVGALRLRRRNAVRTDILYAHKAGRPGFFQE